MSWVNIISKKNTPIKKKEIIPIIDDSPPPVINMSNEEFFYLDKGTYICDELSDIKRESPPWLFSKCSVDDIYNFFSNYIITEDIEKEQIEDSTCPELYDSDLF